MLIHSRKHLLFCPVKNGSVTPEILGEDRNFDVITNDYDGVPDSTTAEFTFHLKKHKWPTIAAIIDQFLELDYEFYCFMDDDIVVTTKTLNQIFEFGSDKKLAIFQPALTHDSGGWHDCVFQKKDQEQHDTGFVEVMCPFFSRSFLSKAWPLIQKYSEKYESGWGLDSLWSKLASFSNDRMTIVDRYPVKHPGKPESEHWILSNSKSPGQEYHECIKDPELLKLTRSVV